MLFLHYLKKFISRFVSVGVCATLCTLSNVNAQTQSKPIEVFSGGHKFLSVEEYKKMQKRRALFAFPSNEDSDVLIDMLLKDTLKEFSDEDLLKFVAELKKRRKDLFKEDKNDPNYRQMKTMLNDYMQTHERASDVELDESKIRTIILDSNFLQMQSMLKSYIQAQEQDIDLKIDATKVKTITIKPEALRDQKDSYEKIMRFKDESFYNLGKDELDSDLEEFQIREQGPLSRNYTEIEGLPIESVLGSLKQNPYFVFSLILNKYSRPEQRIEQTSLFEERSNQRFTLPILNYLIGDVSPQDQKRAKAREVKQILQEFSQSPQYYAPEALSGSNYLGLGIMTTDQVQKRGFVTGTRFPLIMDNEKVTTLSQFLKYQKRDPFRQKKYIPLSDDAMRSHYKVDANWRRSNLSFEASSEGWTYNIEGLQAINFTQRPLGVKTRRRKMYLPPIIIDRTNLDESALPENVNIDEVLDFKTLNLNPE